MTLQQQRGGGRCIIKFLFPAFSCACTAPADAQFWIKHTRHSAILLPAGLRAGYPACPAVLPHRWPLAFRFPNSPTHHCGFCFQTSRCCWLLGCAKVRLPQAAAGAARQGSGAAQGRCEEQKEIKSSAPSAGRQSTNSSCLSIHRSSQTPRLLPIAHPPLSRACSSCRRSAGCRGRSSWASLCRGQSVCLWVRRG